MTTQAGRCCSQHLCINDKLTLNPTHRCALCKQIVHMICAQIDNKTDETVCFKCIETKNNETTKVSTRTKAKEKVAAKVVPRIEAPVEVTKCVGAVSVPIPNLTNKVAKQCPSCGGTDHQRRSSKLCPHNKKRAKQNSAHPLHSSDPTPTSLVNNNANNTNASIADSNATDKDANNHTTTMADTTTAISSNENDTVIDSNNTKKNNEKDDSLLSRPKFISMETQSTAKYQPVIDVSSSAFKMNPTIYKLFQPDHRGRAMETTPTPQNLTDTYWSLTLVNNIRDSSNTYRKLQKKDNPEAWWWKHNFSEEFTTSCIYQFLALIYYFGIVRLPSKRDY